jgi:hypothetical protein
MSIKARPTVYKGIQMRSRLEADYAGCLDRAGSRWAYEPECFASESGQWLPDFGYDWGPFDSSEPFANLSEVKPAQPLMALGRDRGAWIDHVDGFLTRISVARASRPNATLELVFWEYGASVPYLVLYSYSGQPWIAMYRNSPELLWPGMGQYQRLRLESEC